MGIIIVPNCTSVPSFNSGRFVVSEQMCGENLYHQQPSPSQMPNWLIRELHLLSEKFVLQ